MRRRDLEMLNRWMKETEERLSQRIVDAELRLRDSLLSGFDPGTSQLVGLDYAVDPSPRWGYGKPPHPQLLELVDGGRSRYTATLRGFLRHRDDLVAIPATAEPGSAEPAWCNSWLPALDAIALYCFLRDTAPARYVEVGSGVSTTFARRAITDGGLATKTTSIDPHPRAEIDGICDEVVRAPLETADLTIFDAVEPGDVVFFDGSHRSFTNSDVTVFFLEVLPGLPEDVLVQIHDIRLPDDYPPGWERRFYNEQYLLAATLLGGSSRYEVVLPNAFVAGRPELHGILDVLWGDAALKDAEHHGESFWLRTRRAGES